MKGLIKLIMAVFVVFTMSNCAQYTAGPSCTVSLLGKCYDYEKATQTTKDAGETVCKAIMGTWATTGCTYQKCGSPDADGVITCSSN
ncbi:MAG: hypothetical protein OEV78_10340 [Spirochaetia bacterium]|nr:hypothetical protein [Spirochaetia bacterium]